MLRSATTCVLRNSLPKCPGVSQILSTLQSRHPGARNYSYGGSPCIQDVKKPTEAEKSYAEWKWVERLIPPETVPPAPTDPSAEFPSGWKAPNVSLTNNCGYVVRRNKNHQVPVYTMIKDRGQVRETRIKHIEGNIWALEKDAGNFLKQRYPGKIIMTYTQETYRFVGIRGDYTEDLKEWLISRGF